MEYISNGCTYYHSIYQLHIVDLKYSFQLFPAHDFEYTNPLLICRQAEVTRLHEELAALKVATQQVNDDQKASSPQGVKDNKSLDIRSSVVSKADALSSLRSSSSHHSTLAPPTPQVFHTGVS